MAEESREPAADQQKNEQQPSEDELTKFVSPLLPAYAANCLSIFLLSCAGRKSTRRHGMSNT